MHNYTEAMTLHCTADRPWGIHETVSNDGDCARCGWTAPGPKQDALLDAICEAEERAWLRARAAELGLLVLEPAPAERRAA
jgi:hypothetical protein